MILTALRAKLRQRGPLGFATDATEASLACAVIGVHALVLAGGFVGAVLVGLPIAGALRLLETACEFAEYRERP